MHTALKRFARGVVVQVIMPVRSVCRGCGGTGKNQKGVFGRGVVVQVLMPVRSVCKGCGGTGKNQ